MIEIFPNLFIGAESDYEHNVAGQDGWLIVHACKEPYHRNLLGYTGRGAPQDHPEYLFARRNHRLYLNIVDAPKPEFFDRGMIEAALDFIHEGLSKGMKVLVHCNLGESRSPSIGLLYLAARTNAIPADSIENAEDAFRKLYPQYLPKSGIRGFLSLNWAHFVQ